MSRLHQSMLYNSGTNDQSMLYNSGTNDQRLPALSFGQAKPGLSFPLGTGLVVLIILLVSALFSFCYHWLRLRKAGSSLLLPTPSLSRQSSTEPPSDTCSAKAPPTKLSMLPCPPVVYMAGEEMPRFIAVPCAFEGGPCKASTEDAQENCMPEPLDALKLDIRS